MYTVCDNNIGIQNELYFHIACVKFLKARRIVRICAINLFMDIKDN